MSGGYPWTDEHEWFLAKCRLAGMVPDQVVEAYNGAFPTAQRGYQAVRAAMYKRPTVGQKMDALRRGEVPAAGPVEVPTPRAPDDPKIMELERRMIAAQDEARELRAKLKASHRDTTLFDYAAHIIQETTQPLKPVAPIKRMDRAEATPVDAIALLSDEHSDEVLHPSTAWGLDAYSFGIFRCRLQRWAEELSEYLTVHLPAHRFERLWVFKLGDAVNGDIHGMGHRNDFGNTLKAAMATGDAESHAIQHVARTTGLPVHVVCISGNHPRRSKRKDYDGPHDNFDFLVASQIATRLADQPNVEVLAPDAWTSFVDVRGHLCALNHGDDIKGTWGIPWYGVNRRTGRIQDLVSRADRKVSYFFHGHFHQPAQVPAGSAYVRFNGAFPMTSGFAVEGMAVASDPAQSVFVASDKGIVLTADIWLRDLDREDAYRAGTWEPCFGRRTILDELEPDGGRIGELDVIRAP